MEKLKLILHVSEEEDFKNAYRNANNALKAKGVTIAILLNGSAIRHILDEEKINDLLAQNVEVIACMNSLKSHNINPETLNSNITLVAIGIVELAKRQQANYAYIKP